VDSTGRRIVVDNRRMTRTRFSDDSPSYLYSFVEGDTLVACPKCGARAVSRRIGDDRPGWFAPRRLTCTGCSHTDDWHERDIARRWDRARDDFFDLPLWLQTPCCGDVLWVYNAEHLTVLESYVGARLRERSRDPAFGWANKSYFSRLPAWIKSGKNRDEVLAGLARLRERVASTR
jgi:hypothetical protein